MAFEFSHLLHPLRAAVPVEPIDAAEAAPIDLRLGPEGAVGRTAGASAEDEPGGPAALALLLASAHEPGADQVVDEPVEDWMAGLLSAPDDELIRGLAHDRRPGGEAPRECDPPSAPSAPVGDTSCRSRLATPSLDDDLLPAPRKRR
ncbi:MAG: hypothetical protein GEV08_24235 [Acidimicrobiia bacterium]|nr:hypothetical protein [Acidimicrobiia bacterium]